MEEGTVQGAVFSCDPYTQLGSRVQRSWDAGSSKQGAGGAASHCDCTTQSSSSSSSSSSGRERVCGILGPTDTHSHEQGADQQPSSPQRGWSCSPVCTCSGGVHAREKRDKGTDRSRACVSPTWTEGWVRPWLGRGGRVVHAEEWWRGSSAAAAAPCMEAIRTRVPSRCGHGSQKGKRRHRIGQWECICMRQKVGWLQLCLASYICI